MVMIQNKQQLLNALLTYYQNKVDFLTNKKIQFLKKLVKQSDELKIKKLKNEIEKPKI